MVADVGFGWPRRPENLLYLFSCFLIKLHQKLFKFQDKFLSTISYLELLFESFL